MPIFASIRDDILAICWSPKDPKVNPKRIKMAFKIYPIQYEDGGKASTASKHKPGWRNGGAKHSESLADSESAMVH